MSDNNNNWQNDPSLQNISADKMQYLMKMMSEVNGKDKNSLLPFLMGLSSSSEQNGMDFSDNETDLILQVLSQKMTPEERSKIDMIRNLSRMIAMKNKTKK
ncbi:hypothetical protein [Hominifimenecus sp. rT4P-3]|uniref:hypothetical protein n=1 Tax=Hominifimenecus sp. rT4P-3 TaxID=3242979 RepID=UPI003DA5E013